MYKMVVSDFCGTLINSEEAISVSTMLEIDRIRKSDILFCITPSNRGGYNVHTIPREKNTHITRCDLPSSWGGLCDKELQDVSGVESATFCHLSLFLGACGIGDTNTTYNRSQIGRQGTTSTGRIISMTQIEIAGSNEGGTLVGAGVGGVAGGIAGSMFGHGKGSDLMAIAGGTVGALVGGAVGGVSAGDLGVGAVVRGSGAKIAVDSQICIVVNRSGGGKGAVDRGFRFVLDAACRDVSGGGLGSRAGEDQGGIRAGDDLLGCCAVVGHIAEGAGGKIRHGVGDPGEIDLTGGIDQRCGGKVAVPGRRDERLEVGK